MSSNASEARSRAWARAFTFLIVVCGAVVVGVAARRGVGVLPDSVQFLTAAQRLRDVGRWEVLGRDATFAPLSQFPPLYPTALAGMIAVTGDRAWDAAFPLHISLTAINLWLIAALATRFARGSVWAGAWAALAASVSLGVVRCHSQALSEPLFIALTLCAWRSLARQFDRPTGGALFLAVLFTAMAALTRYTGVAMILAGTLWLAWSRSTPSKSTWTRAAHAFVYCAVSTLPVAWWLVAVSRGSTSIAGRALTLHPPTWQDGQVLCATICGWAVPVALPPIVLSSVTTVAPLVLVLAALLALRGLGKSNLSAAAVLARARSRWETLPALWALCYFVVLLAVRWCADAALAFDDRMLLPVQILVFAFVSGWICRRWNVWRTKARAGVAVAFILVAALNVAQTLCWAVTVADNGQGFSAESWRESPVWPYLQGVDPDVVIHSNAPDAVFFWTGRPARMLPIRVDVMSLLPNERFDDEFRALGADLRQGRAMVVHFDAVGWRWYLPGLEDTQARVSPPTCVRVGAATVLRR